MASETASGSVVPLHTRFGAVGRITASGGGEVDHLVCDGYSCKEGYLDIPKFV